MLRIRFSYAYFLDGNSKDADKNNLNGNNNNLINNTSACNNGNANDDINANNNGDAGSNLCAVLMAKEDLRLVEKPIPEPQKGQVLIRMQKVRRYRERE